MNKRIGVLAVLLLSSSAVQASSSIYEYEQYDTLKYARQTRAQAKEMDRVADAAEKYQRENQRALEQARRQELAFSHLRHAEDSLARSRAFITEYPDYGYQVTITENKTKAVLK